MNLDRAIEINEDYHKRLPRGVNDDFLDAFKLGIEALKDLLRFDEIRGKQARLPLPGETVERLILLSPHQEAVQREKRREPL